MSISTFSKGYPSLSLHYDIFSCSLFLNLSQSFSLCLSLSFGRVFTSQPPSSQLKDQQQVDNKINDSTPVSSLYSNNQLPFSICFSFLPSSLERPFQIRPFSWYGFDPVHQHLHQLLSMMALSAAISSQSNRNNGSRPENLFPRSTVIDRHRRWPLFVVTN